MKILRKYYPTAIVIVVTICCFVFFQYGYPYHFFYQEQNQLFLCSIDYISSLFDKPGGMARLVGEFLTQWYYYLFAGATIVSFCILLTGLLTYQAGRNLGLKRIWALSIALLLMVLTTVCHFSVEHRLSSTISIIGWLLMFALISIIKEWKWRLTLLAVALLPTYLLMGLPNINKLQKPDFVLEQAFAVDSEYYFGNHQRVIEMVESAETVTDEMMFFYNLVQAQRGMLPDHLLRFMPTQLGTFYKIGPKTPRLTIINMNELYWLLGDMTFTERAAMMTNVFAPDNRNVRMIKRLAECNIVSGDTLAANKYLRILDKTLVHRKWSAKARQNPLYAEKAVFVNRHDTIAITDNAHFLMTQLLESNPDNVIALDYILCSTLLLKDITSFKRDYDYFCINRGKPRLKKLYQEALCIWLAATNASSEEWQQYVMDTEILRRFEEYNELRGSIQFKDTYWYYFDQIKAPEA